MIRFQILIVLLFTFSSVSAQTVNIPDSNFKAYLVSNPTINLNSDSEIQVSEAANCTASIICPNLGISDLTGIEAFTSITYLRCDDNNLTSLDLSNNVALVYLFCWSNQLTALDLSNNVNLFGLSVTDNPLTSLDLSHNIALKTLVCEYTELTTLDVSGNPELNNINVGNNDLTNLNVANGNNEDFILFRTFNNPSLECIQVDNAAYSNSNWIGSGSSLFMYDGHHYFSEDCTLGLESEELNEVRLYPNPANVEITIASEVDINGISIIASNGQTVLTTTSSKISIEGLAHGVYIVKVSVGNQVIRKRFVKA